MCQMLHPRPSTSLRIMRLRTPDSSPKIITINCDDSILTKLGQAKQPLSNEDRVQATQISLLDIIDNKGNAVTFFKYFNPSFDNINTYG